jgi:hypothetical protein
VKLVDVIAWLIRNGNAEDEVAIGEVPNGMAIKIYREGDDFPSASLELEVGQ